MNAALHALEVAFHAAVAASQPAEAVRRFLPEAPEGRTVVVGAGKAASTMALAFERAYEPAIEGVVVTRYGHALDPLPTRVRVLEASHPVPDAAGVAATQGILSALRGLRRDDLAVCLISGGGSALLCAPDGVTLPEKMAVTDALLRSGADITEMNVVRKHLSAVKGGRLARAASPARVVGLIVSDVVGDDLSAIASGPTVPDASTFAEALGILERYGIKHEAARAHFERGLRGEAAESLKPGDEVFERVENHLIVTNAMALEAARAALASFRFQARVLSDRVVGEARDEGRRHAREALKLEPGQAILSGGETTVTVRGTGRGGRNLEFLLGLALELQGQEGVYAIACDTDGIDGTDDAAGATVTPDTLERARGLGLDARAMLERNDAYSFFARLGDLVKTGPTGTNVNDFRCVVRT